MATGTHRVDHGQSEVKLQVRVDEGCHKATTGSIHMDSHVPSILLVQRLCINKARVQSIADSYAGQCMPFFKIHTHTHCGVLVRHVTVMWPNNTWTFGLRQIDVAQYMHSTNLPVQS